jgi:hypothetical protein
MKMWKMKVVVAIGVVVVVMGGRQSGPRPARERLG